MPWRMSIARCCCNAGVCGPGETSWFDDFDSYSTGEDLTTYGYGAAGTAEEQSGQMYVRPAVSGPNWCVREFPFDRILHDEIAFEADLNTANQSVNLFSEYYLIGFNFYVVPFVYIVFNGTNDVTYGAGSSVTNDTPTCAAGDAFKVVATKTAQTSTTIDFDYEYFINGSSVHTDSGTVDKADELLLIDFCRMMYGIQGNSGSLSDNWDFSVT